MRGEGGICTAQGRFPFDRLAASQVGMRSKSGLPEVLDHHEVGPGADRPAVQDGFAIRGDGEAGRQETKVILLESRDFTVLAGPEI